MEIRNSTIEDIDEIFRLYALASAYQESKKTVVVWPQFERSLVEAEIAEKRQWKMLMNGEIGCVWATTFSDAEIWEKRNEDPSVYIHRIATNPNCRGQNFVTNIVAWAKGYAKDNHKDFIRLDTIGNNERLIQLYQQAGFNFLGLADLRSTDRLPAHYKLGPAALFEIKL